MQLQILGSWNKFKYIEIQNTKKQPTNNKWMKSLQSCSTYQTKKKSVKSRTESFHTAYNLQDHFIEQGT
jgi:hypothetical protein